MPPTLPLSSNTVAVIGLGLMGKPMAKNLKAAGADVIVHNRSQGVIGEMAALGFIPAATPAQAVEKADTVIMMLSDTPAVKAVVLGDDGIVSGLAARGGGALIIDMGTTEVPATRQFADAVHASGGTYVDAPVSGGTIGAEQGTLTIMAGGSEPAVARAWPVLEVLGSRITHVGETGAGQVAKAANQVIVGLNIGAVAEALSLAKRCGVDPAKVREALQGGFADSRILEVHGQRMIDGVFEPGGKCVTQRKDMDQALRLAIGLGLEMPATELNRDLYDRLIADGDGDLDHSALIKAIDWP